MMGDLLLDRKDATPEAGSMVRSVAGDRRHHPCADHSRGRLVPRGSACCSPTTIPTCAS